jgi:hypothetical protein
MNELQIKPNVPVTVALVNPECAAFNFEDGFGLYETTDGQTFVLPRPAVVLLNMLDPEPGEEIVITKHWTGKRAEKAEWTISLSPRSENARAQADNIGQDEAVAPPTPIRRPTKRAPAPEIQPRLFDRGTGTHGPAPQTAPLSIPLPAVAIGRQQRPGQIPANIATKEILAFVNADPSTANWSADARQDLCSTILIASFKAGYIGLWERGGQ